MKIRLNTLNLLNTGSKARHNKQNEQNFGVRKETSGAFLNNYPKNYYINSDISFGYNFELRNPKGIPCAYCGKETLSKDGIIEMSKLQGDELVSMMDKYEKIAKNDLTPQQLEALKIYKRYAKNHPDKSGKTLMPIVFTRSRNKMLIKQQAVYSNIEKMANDIQSEELLNYIAKLREQDIILKPSISAEKLSEFLVNNVNIQYRKEVIASIQEIAQRDENPDNKPTWQKIAQEIQNLPSSKNDSDAFLVKHISRALRKDPKIESEILPIKSSEVALFYSTLFGPCLSSAEHMKPFSHNGKSHYSNYLLTHRSCNEARSNIPWDEFLKDNPEKFDLILANLEHILNLDDKESGLKKTSARNYVKKISLSMHKLLGEAPKDPTIDSYIKKLDDFRQQEFPYTAFFETKNAQNSGKGQIKGIDEKVLASILQKLSAALAVEDEDAKQAGLEDLLYNTLYEVKTSRENIYFHSIETARKVKCGDLEEALIAFRKHDPVLKLDASNTDAISKIFNADFSMEYGTNLQETLDSIFPEGSDNVEVEKIIYKIPRKLQPIKNKGILVNILINAKIDDNTYDTKMLEGVLNLGNAGSK